MYDYFAKETTQNKGYVLITFTSISVCLLAWVAYVPTSPENRSYPKCRLPTLSFNHMHAIVMVEYQV